MYNGVRNDYDLGLAPTEKHGANRIKKMIAASNYDTSHDHVHRRFLLQDISYPACSFMKGCKEGMLAVWKLAIKVFTVLSFFLR